MAGTGTVWINCPLSPFLVRRRVEDDHRHREGDQAEQLGGGEADEQPALLAVGSGRIADGALEERAEHVADAERGGADADRGEARADDLGRSEIHEKSPWLEAFSEG